MFRSQLWSNGWSAGRIATNGFSSTIFINPEPSERVYYYPKTLRNITLAMLDLFDDIQVKDYDKNNVLVKTTTLPITFGPVSKFQQEGLQVESGKHYTMQVPRLALEYTGTHYDSNRTTGTNETRYFYDSLLDINDVDSFFSDVQPAPYNNTFNLHIRTRALDHYNQIIENILPYFNPALYLRIKEFSFLNIERDLQVTLDSITPDFLDIQDNNSVREVNAVLSFTVKGFMYRPISTASIIKKIRFSTFYTDKDDNAIKASKYFRTESEEFRESISL
jgi:hypothetical protein